MSVLRVLWVGAGPGVRAGLAMPGPVCLNFPLGLMMASGMKVAERGQSSRDTGPGWGMSSYSVQHGGRGVGEQLQVRARGGLVPGGSRPGSISLTIHFLEVAPGPARLARGTHRVRRGARPGVLRAESQTLLSSQLSSDCPEITVSCHQCSVHR